MRTTIEITDTQRAKLLELAAERGEKGFSHLVQEAIDLYLRDKAANRDRVRAALAAMGSFTEDEAGELRAHVCETRRSWR